MFQGQMFRVLHPGGLLVIEDSAPLSERAEIGTALRSVPGELHEPFVNDDLEDDLANLARDRIAVTSPEPHFVAKVVVAKKP